MSISAVDLPGLPADIASQSVVAYLKLGDVQGESHDTAHPGWIEVDSFQWGAGSQSAGGGGGAGKVSLGEFTIVKQVDKASPIFFQDAAQGKHLASGILELTSPKFVVDYKLSDISISAVQEQSGANNPIPLEKVSLNFSKVEVDYTPYNADGAPGQTVVGIVTQKGREVPPGPNAQPDLFSIASPQTVVAYLKLDGVPGSSLSAQHEKWIEVDSFQWGAGSHGAGGGGGAGKVSLSDFTIVKQVDKASPVLFQDAAQGKHLASGILELTSPNGQFVVDYKLSDIDISAVQEQSGANNPVPLEKVSLNFSKVEVDYTPYNADGAPGQAVVGIVTQKASLPTAAPTSAQPDLFSIASPQTVVAYLKLDGVPGSSLSAQHEKWIEVDSFQWGAGRHGAGGGGGAGKVSLSDFTIVKQVDKASPILFQDAAQGKHIASGILELTSPNRQFVVDYKLSDISISAVQEQSGANNPVPLEKVSLNFSKIEVDYTPYNADGAPGQTVVGLVTQKGREPASPAAPAQPDLFSIASPQTVVAYLKLDGVPGSSLNVNHDKWIEVDSFQWGAGSHGAGGGGGAGKVSLSDFTIVKQVDKASPILFQDAAQGKHIASGILELTSPNGQFVVDYKLSDISISAVQEQSGANNPVPLEKVSLNFSKIELDYTPYNADGAPGQTVVGIVTQKASLPTAAPTSAQPDLFSIASPQTVVAYLKLDGVPGTSLNVGHEKWIEVDSFQWGAGSHGAGGGGGAGKVSLSDFTIVKQVDKASPILFQDAVQGKHIRSGILELTSPNGQFVVDYKLSDIDISAVQEQSGANNPVPLEKVSLNFSNIELDYTPYNADGAPGQTVVGTVTQKGREPATPAAPAQPDLFSIASPQTVVAYLKLDGVPGTSLDVGHEKWIEVDSFQWGAGSHSAGGGGGAGKVSLSDFTIVKQLDSASPVLFQDAAQGKYIASGILELTSPDGQFVIDYKLSDIYISAVQEESGANNPVPLEKVSLKFSKIEVDYIPYNADGAPGQTVVGIVTQKDREPASQAASAQPDLFSIASPQTVVAYLTLDGVPGSSLDSKQVDWIEVNAIQPGVSVDTHPLSELT